jgi:hypothetical protein
MNVPEFRYFIFTTALILGAAAQAAAQECIGISPTARGYFAYGVEGTDGATGEGFTLGVRIGQAGLQLHRRTLEPVSVADDIESLHAQVAVPLSKKVPLCAIGGIGWTGYDTDRIFSWGTDVDGNTVQTGTAGGPYLQLRAPIGLAIGKELKVTERFRVAGFVSNSVVYDFERVDSHEAGRRLERHSLGFAANLGLSLNYGRIMLRPSLYHFTTLRQSYDQYNDFPFASLQLGVRF